jgi:ferritin heavy chain
MDRTFQMERENNDRLLRLHDLAEKQNDPQMTDYLESEFLQEQAKSIKQISDMNTTLQRVGSDGMGLYLFDRELLKGYAHHA